jgi:uncharacterized membrane protein (DUF2068 family)
MATVRAPAPAARPMPVTIAAILLVLIILGSIVAPLLPSSEGVFVVAFVAALICIVALIGLWMLRKWGYIVTIIAAAINLLLSAGDAFGSHAWIRVAGIVFVLMCAAIIVLVTRPEARRAYR